MSGSERTVTQSVAGLQKLCGQLHDCRVAAKPVAHSRSRSDVLVLHAAPVYDSCDASHLAAPSLISQAQQGAHGLPVRLRASEFDDLGSS